MNKIIKNLATRAQIATAISGVCVIIGQFELAIYFVLLAILWTILVAIMTMGSIIEKLNTPSA